VAGDLTQAKRRPALVVSMLEGDDLILSSFFSREHTDKNLDFVQYFCMFTKNER
jgi:hypothetical protein